SYSDTFLSGPAPICGYLACPVPAPSPAAGDRQSPKLAFKDMNPLDHIDAAERNVMSDKNRFTYPDTLVWTVDDVAKQLKVSKRHIFRLVKDRKIPYAKVGRSLRFSPRKIAIWIDGGGTN